MLERLDPNPEYWEGKRGAAVGVFQMIIAGREDRSVGGEKKKMLIDDKWRFNYCKSSDAHLAAEFIFGKTVTSHFSKWGNAWTDSDTWSAENAYGFKAVLAMHCDLTWMIIGTVIGFQKHLWNASHVRPHVRSVMCSAWENIFCLLTFDL